MAKKVKAGSPRIRPEMAKDKVALMLWKDHRRELAKLGGGSVSAGVALLVARHLDKPLPQYGKFSV